LVPSGTTFSYSNAAFYVLAHIIETVRRKPFEHVIRERIFAPLGMDESFYFPEQCMTYRVASGHIVTAAGPQLARRWHMWRSGAGGGGVISNVVDQLRYAALHVGAVDAPSVLSGNAVARMQHVERRAGSLCESIGIAWMLDDAGGGRRLVKHGGATNGQVSSFELIPAERFAVTVLTNSDTGRDTRGTIADRAQEHFLGFGKPEPIEAREAVVDISEYVGAYHATMEHLGVRADGSRLQLTGTAPPTFVANADLRPLPVPVAQLEFTARDEAAVLTGPHRGERVEFLRDDAGHIAWLRWDGRIARRQA
jgi:CubicO group peptidase (beta-lactamase class C family)